MLYLCVGLEHEEKEQTKPFGFATVHAIQKVASSVIDSLGRDSQRRRFNEYAAPGYSRMNTIIGTGLA